MVRHLGVWMLLAALNGCALFARKEPPPVQPPEMQLATGVYLGTPLSGPVAGKLPSVVPSEAMRLEVQWIALEAMPAGELLPLDTQSRLTIAPMTSSTVLPAGLITRPVRFGAGHSAEEFTSALGAGKFGKSIALSTQSSLIVPETTVFFAAGTAPGSGKPSNHLAVSFYYPIKAGKSPTTMATTQPVHATIAVQVEDATEAGRETALLDDVPFIDGSRYALVAPVPFNDGHWRALVALVQVHFPEQDAVDAKALAEFQDQLKASVESARAVAARQSSGQWATLSGAIAGLGQPGGLRSSLLFLASNTGASIASDFVLVADESLLARLSDETIRFAASINGPIAPDKLAYLLDRTALALAAESAGKTDAPPEISALLSLCAGEVGRHADAIPDLLKMTASSKDIEQRLIEENVIYLEDNSPSSRVRAFDWLKSRGKAPADFDPLGSRKARRAALDKAYSTPGSAP